MTTHAFITGATGLIGRWLVPALTRRGLTVTALVRGATEREEEYLAWVEAHGGIPEQVRLVEGDLALDDLGMSEASRALAREASFFYHLGATMRFGLDPQVARATNEGGTERIVRLAASADVRPRFVLISGFMVGASKPTDLEGAGAYEATKVRAHRQTCVLAAKLGMPLTVVNPGCVIGDSTTGETTMLWGFSEVVRDLRDGKMPAMPGGSRHWMPLITVDYLAEFLARVPLRDTAEKAEYFLLDDATPKFGALLAILANQLGVRAPRFHVPMAIVPLFMRLTGQADKIEGLTFISTDSFDTSSATRAAAENGLTLPDMETALRRNVDFLVARNFLPSAAVGASGVVDRAGDTCRARATPLGALRSPVAFGGVRCLARRLAVNTERHWRASCLPPAMARLSLRSAVCLTALLSLAVVAACTDLPSVDDDADPIPDSGTADGLTPGEAGPVDRDAAAPDPAAPVYRSGTRLKVRWAVTGDGYREFDGWYDAIRKEPCVREAAADGVQRCLPRDTATTSTVFSDSNCTARLAQTADRVGNECKLPLNVALVDAAGGRHIHQIGAKSINTFMKGTDGVCTVVKFLPRSYYEIGSEIPASSFVALAEEPATSVGRLAERYAESADGAHQFLGWFDQSLASSCSFGVARDASVRCLPSSALAGDYFGDDACAVPVVTFDASRTDTPLFAYLPPASCGAGTSVYRVGKSIPSAMLRRREGATCAAANVNRNAWTIAELGPSELVAPVVVKDANGRIRGMYDEAPDGKRQLRRWTDTMLGDVSCTFTTTADGQVRCVPPAASPTFGDRSDGISFNNYYSDAACMKPLRLAYTTKGNCDPPLYARAYEATCNYPVNYYRLKASRYTAVLYENTGTCVKSSSATTSDFYEIDKEVPLTDFAAGALLIDP